MIDGESWGVVEAVAPRYEPWIAKLERTAAMHPLAYRRKVVVAGLLGYAVLGGLLAIPTGLMSILIIFLSTDTLPRNDAARYLGVVGIVTFVLYMAMRISRARTAGVALSAQQAPGLFDTVERLRGAMTAPPVHEIRLCATMNAGLVQQPRFGGLAAPRNVLILGLPLFYGLTVREIEAAIAHELGHAVAAHNWSLEFVYGVRGRWTQIGGRLSSGVLAGILRRFFAWYGPWFVAYSQVLIREHEFEADRSAVKIVGPAALASTLRRFAVKSIGWDWHLAARAEQSRRRGLSGATALRRALADLSSRHANDQDILDYTLSFEAQLDDTHPVLAKRLAALSQSATVSEPVGQAGTSLLGSSAETFITLFGEDLLQRQPSGEPRASERR